MKLERYIYLDAPGIASLYAQLRGEDVVETLCSMEHGRSSSLKLALAAFLGLSGSGESTQTENQTRTTKKVLRPENMLREIAASLRAHGTLQTSLADAVKLAKKTKAPVWFETKHKFSVPPTLDEFNKARSMLFVSGFPPYCESSKAPKISMAASLHHFPTARDGQLGVSGHDALLIRQLNGEPYLFSIFGSIFSCGDEFQVKPYAIHL